METDEQLIQIVQEYSNLYDLGDKNYHNLLMRENSWEEIGQRLDLPGKTKFYFKILSNFDFTKKAKHLC